MKSEQSRARQTGAVTFLDVLGWKGIWQQNSSAIETLRGLVQETMNKAITISNEYSEQPEFRGKKEITNVLSISDTIAVFTEGSPTNTIEIHTKICSWLLGHALNQEIPIRGAISYGEYIVQDNIMLGYAVDEAASWHESTDWIGVILTPSAQMKIDNDIALVTEYNKIPFKQSEKNLIKCVDWQFPEQERLMEVITAKGPLTPDIAPKYLNTLAFLNRPKDALERED